VLQHNNPIKHATINQE